MPFEAHWSFDATPSDEWPMAIEADELEIKALRMPVEYENGDVSNIRFVPEGEVSRLKEENARLRALLIDAYEEFVRPYGDADAIAEYADRMRDRGIEVE